MTTIRRPHPHVFARTRRKEADFDAKANPSESPTFLNISGDWGTSTMRSWIRGAHLRSGVARRTFVFRGFKQMTDIAKPARPAPPPLMTRARTQAVIGSAFFAWGMFLVWSGISPVDGAMVLIGGAFVAAIGGYRILRPAG